MFGILYRSMSRVFLQYIGFLTNLNTTSESINLTLSAKNKQNVSHLKLVHRNRKVQGLINVLRNM